MDTELKSLLEVREAELQRTLALLIEGQRLSKTGSVTINLVTDEHYWSDEVYRIFERSIGERVPIQIIREMVHPDDFAVYEDFIARTLKGVSTDVVFRVLPPSGVTKHVRAVAHVIEQSNGTIFHGAIQDITDMVRAEEALNKARAELARMSRITTLSALTASMAHEVSQPLTGIVANAGLCLRLLAAEPANVDDARAAVQRALRDATRAIDVVARLRGLFSHKPSGITSVDLNETTLEVLALSTAELQRHGIVRRTDLAEGLPSVSADRVQLQQVILNLVLNAADAMREIEGRPRDLLIATRPEADGGVRLSVRDVGIGIDDAETEHLFDAFYTTKAEGMGIGLSISRSILERHNGRIWAQSNDGPGATFSFVLPPQGSGVEPFPRSM